MLVVIAGQGSSEARLFYTWTTLFSLPLLKAKLQPRSPFYSWIPLLLPVIPCTTLSLVLRQVNVLTLLSLVKGIVSPDSSLVGALVALLLMMMRRRGQ